MLALILLALAGLVAGYVNASAGAGSLLTLPALIFSGLDPSAANATNRIAILFQNAAAFAGYRRGGAVTGGSALWVLIPAGIGACVGAWVATLLDPGVIRIAIAVAMLGMLPLSFMRPRGATARTDHPAPVKPGLLAGFFLIGVYGGFIQVGVGVVILLFLSGTYRMRLVAANTLKVVVILVLSVVAIAVFAFQAETLDIERGLILAVATSAGGYIGARAAIKRGEGFVRILVTLAVVASAISLIYQAL